MKSLYMDGIFKLTNSEFRAWKQSRSFHSSMPRWQISISTKMLYGLVYDTKIFWSWLLELSLKRDLENKFSAETRKVDFVKGVTLREKFLSMHRKLMFIEISSGNSTARNVNFFALQISLSIVLVCPSV